MTDTELQPNYRMAHCCRACTFSAGTTMHLVCYPPGHRGYTGLSVSQSGVCDRYTGREEGVNNEKTW